MEYEFILRIFTAAILGGLIGLEREWRAKEAGLRTHFLVALGSAVFMIVSAYGFSDVQMVPEGQRISFHFSLPHLSFLSLPSPRHPLP